MKDLVAKIRIKPQKSDTWLHMSGTNDSIKTLGSCVHPLAISV